MENDIFINQSQPTSNPSQKAPTLMKAILIIFALIIAVEFLIGLKTLLTPLKIIPKPQITNTISDGSILLTTSKAQYNIGEVVPVTVKVTTGGHLTAGVDLVLKYDPAKLEASSSSFTSGSIYDDYPPINLDTAGSIRISGVVSTNRLGFNGDGEFGKINFKASAPGETEVLLDFTPNKTQDSNMLEIGTNKDVLGKVGSVKIKIQ